MQNTIEQIHFPVMSAEVLSLLKIDPKGIYCDGTIGLGGHAEKIIQKLSGEGHLIGIDRDEKAISLCRKRLTSSRFTKISLFNDSFINAKTLFEGGIDEKENCDDEELVGRIEWMREYILNSYNQKESQSNN